MSSLYDAYGRPLRRRKLPGGVDIFWQLPAVEALTAWDVATAKAASSALETGDFPVAARMYWAMLSDPRIADGVSKRALALRGLKYKIVPGKGQAAKTVAAKFEQAFPQMRPPHVAAEIFSQELLLGHSVVQPEWGYSADHMEASTTPWDVPRFPDDGWYYPRLRTWEPTALKWRTSLTTGAGQRKGELVALTEGSERAAQGQDPSGLYGEQCIGTGTGQWMVFTLAGDARPWMHGRMRAIWRPWISRLMDMLLWLRFNDVHGLPIRGVKVPMGMRKTQEMQQFYQNVKTVGRDASFLMPQGTDGKFGVGIDLIEAKSESWKSFEAGLAYYGTEITVSLTGGTQNAEATGGNYKGAEEQREIRHEVKAGDADADALIVNTQLAPAFAMLNGYGPETAPRIEYDTAPPVNRKAEAEGDAAEYGALKVAGEACAAMRAAGYEVTIPDLLASRGREAPAGKVVQIQVPAQAAQESPV